MDMRPHWLNAPVLLTDGRERILAAFVATSASCSIMGSPLCHHHLPLGPDRINSFIKVVESFIIRGLFSSRLLPLQAALGFSPPTDKSSPCSITQVSGPFMWVYEPLISYCYLMEISSSFPQNNTSRKKAEKLFLDLHI